MCVGCSALDEIVMRTVKYGLMDRDGSTYAPGIVRAGVNMHHSVKAFSLDAIVESRMGGDKASCSGVIEAMLFLFEVSCLSL